MVKVKAYELKNKKSEELESMLDEFKTELATLRVAKTTGGPASKLSKISMTRKNVARIMTVINQKKREAARELYKGKKYLPKDLRAKKTRAMRRALTQKVGPVEWSVGGGVGGGGGKGRVCGSQRRAARCESRARPRRRLPLLLSRALLLCSAPLCSALLAPSRKFVLETHSNAPPPPTNNRRSR